MNNKIKLFVKLFVINIKAKIIDWHYRQSESFFYRHDKLSFIHDNFFLLPKLLSCNTMQNDAAWMILVRYE